MLQQPLGRRMHHLGCERIERSRCPGSAVSAYGVVGLDDAADIVTDASADDPVVRSLRDSGISVLEA